MFITLILITLIIVCLCINKWFKSQQKWDSPNWNSDKKIFYHYWKSDHKVITLKALWKFIVSFKPKWPDRISPQSSPLVESSDDLRITNIGHATFLMQVCGLNIITDPVFSTHAGPFGRFGPRRIVEPGIMLEALPPINIAFISHNHYDHLDKFSVKRLNLHKDIIFIVPLGIKRVLLKWGISRPIIELDWGQSHQVGKIKITAKPAQHWSRRGLFDTNKTLWMSGIFEAPQKTIFFAGDTGLGEHFRDIAASFSKIDIGLLPIGSHKPREIMMHQHMSPIDALEAHKILKLKTLIPIHYDVFPLGAEPFLSAEEELIEGAKIKGIPANELCILKVGEYSEWNRDDGDFMN